MDTFQLMMHRRKQILVNSCIYYVYNESIITDARFDTLARDLVRLNKENPDLIQKGEFALDFIDFDGTTGFNLPLYGGWVDRQAIRLIDFAKRNDLLL